MIVALCTGPWLQKLEVFWQHRRHHVGTALRDSSCDHDCASDNDGFIDRRLLSVAAYNLTAADSVTVQRAQARLLVAARHLTAAHKLTAQ